MTSITDEATSSTDDVPPPAVGGRHAAGNPRRLTRRQDAITMLVGTWLMVGLFVDGWAHNTLDSSLETFFTPWHGLFYSGFTACAAWIGWVCFGPGAARRGRRVVPLGYGSSLIGLAMFAAGGAGDMTWHIVLGIETDIDALFSPTHLLLFLGIVLILGAPFRAAWADDPVDAAPSLRAFAPALASLTLMTALVAFFFMYWSVFTNRSPSAPIMTAVAGAGDFADWLTYAITVDGVASALTTTIVLLAPLLLALRRWRIPFGSATALFTTVAVLSSALEGFAMPLALLAAPAAGLTADMAIRRLRPSSDRPTAARIMAMLTAAVLVASWFLSLWVTVGVGFAAEMWTGTIVWAVLAGLGLSMLMFPAPVQAVAPAPATDLDLPPSAGVATARGSHPDVS